MTEISSKQRLQCWLEQTCGLTVRCLEPLPQVISQRCYYRALTDQGSYVVTDASESPQSIKHFPLTAQVLRRAGLYTPKLLHVDLTRGWLLQEDLGSTHWYDCQQQGAVEVEYEVVLSDLFRLQRFSPVMSEDQIPVFDWQSYAQRAVMGVELYWQDRLVSPAMRLGLGEVVDACIDLLMQNEQVLCHRDFHSRNIMVGSDQKIAHIDFQMLCIGPMAYDLASILRDAYVNLPESMMMRLLKGYFAQCHQNGWLEAINWPEFLLWFDAATVLRYLRCIGLFERLKQQPLYQQAHTNALKYLRQAALREPLFERLLELL